jgi:predicted anti-sigma-YlaC factor YlaD
MNCHETIDLMDVALEGGLAAGTRAGFDEHLAECGPCRNYYQQLGLTLRALERLRTPGGTSRRRAELIAEFRRRHREPS